MRWDVLPLGELAASADGAIAIGPFGSAMKADTYTETGVPVVRGTNISDTRAWKGDWVFIPEKLADSMNRCVVFAGDLVLPHRGSIGEVAIIPDDERGRYFISSSLMKITLDRQKVDPLFCYYFLRSAEGRVEILRFSSSVGTPGIGQPLTSLRQFRVPVPPLPEQRAIAATLGALDDKIELNRRMNATLESMARALFRDWFVDFGPTRAKAAGTAPGAQSESAPRDPWLPPDLWSLFPDRLDKDGKPEGWEVSKLSNLAEVTMGISPDGSTYNDEGVGTPLCNGPVEYGDFFLRQIKWTTAPNKLAQRGDLIICVRGSTTGRHAFADAEYCLGRGVASIRGRECNQEFVETALLSQMARLLEKATGSVFPSLSAQDIKNFTLIDPGSTLFRAFAGVVRPMREKIWANVEESRTLARTRDLLLPRLMSGELRLGEAERLASEVA